MSDSTPPSPTLAPAHEETLGEIKAILEAQPSFTSGTMPLASTESTLFYAQGPDAWRIDLANATDDQLVHLSQICAAATFGRNHEDVLDETYRKARKLDCCDFACHYDPVQSGLVRVACGDILAAKDGSRPVRAELYKLNIYGPGSFFKPHQDTPRASNMFGSLVVAFPTQHEGGALVLRPRNMDTEVCLDFSQWLGAKKEPHVAYACFFGDVEHEVYEVTKGYRVTLTYNLYYADQDVGVLKPSKIVQPIEQNPLLQKLSTLLDDSPFLPNGGTLGFGLRYQYSVDERSDSKTIASVLNVMKGSDADLLYALRSSGLDPFLMVIYEEEGYTIMCPEYVEPPEEIDVDDDWVSDILLSRWAGGSVIGHSVRQRRKDSDVKEHVRWVTSPWTNMNTHGSQCIAYGNQASLSGLYGDLSLIVRIGPPGSRGEVAE